MDNVKIGSAYLIKIDINAAEERSSSFKEMWEQAAKSADLCVSFNGETKEFTLEEVGKLLGFKSELEQWADEVIEIMQEVVIKINDIALGMKRALEDPINRVGGLK